MRYHRKDVQSGTDSAEIELKYSVFVRHHAYCRSCIAAADNFEAGNNLVCALEYQLKLPCENIRHQLYLQPYIQHAPLYICTKDCNTTIHRLHERQGLRGC